MKVERCYHTTNSHKFTYVHFPLKCWENVLSELGSENGKVMVFPESPVQSKLKSVRDLSAGGRCRTEPRTSRARPIKLNERIIKRTPPRKIMLGTKSSRSCCKC